MTMADSTSWDFSSRRGKAEEVPVRLQAPLDVAASLEMFRRTGDDGIDRWDGSTLVRTVSVPLTLPSPATGAGALDHGSVNTVVAYRVTTVGSVDDPQVVVAADRPGALDAIVAIVQRTFVTEAAAALAELAARDPVIAELDRRYPGLRPVRQFDLLGALVRSISAQQVNLQFATITRRRLAEAFGERLVVGGRAVWRLQAPVLAGLRVADLRALQFSTRKAEYIINAAQEIASGKLSLAVLEALPDEAVIATLTSLRGIGVWTAEWLLARTLGRPRVVAGDLGVRKAVGLLYLRGALPSEARVRERTAPWGPAAGIAQVLALHLLAEGGGAELSRGAQRLGARSRPGA